MKKKSANGSKVRIRHARDLPPPTPADLARVRAAVKKHGGASDEFVLLAAEIERRGVPPEKPREARNSRIRLAVTREMSRREWTSYAVWKRARRTCPTLPQSAVYEFISGTRAIGLEYVEAILHALDLQVTPARSPSRQKHRAA
jgi:hypothetical protein